MRNILSIVAAAVLAVGLASQASAEESGPPSQTTPVLPSLPLAVSRTGSFFLFPSGNVLEGQIQQSIWWTFGGGAGDPYTGQLLSLGDASSNVQLQLLKAPLASAYASATQSTAYGRSQGASQLSYLVTLTASDAASAQTIEGLLGTSGAIASVSGMMRLTGRGYGYSTAAASTGQLDGLADDLGATIYGNCGTYGEATPSGAAGCGTSAFTLPLNFVPGDHFSDGAPMSFYSVITLSTNTNAGTAGCCSGGYAGTASAFVDPRITLADGIHATLTLGAGDIGNESPVPEPAQWCLLLAGLGGVLLMRRRELRRV